MNQIKEDFYTKTEIEGQPKLWNHTMQALLEDEEIKTFLEPLLHKPLLNIILTGAGTSAYIGETTQHLYGHTPGIVAKAVSTTTLVTHFASYADVSSPLLLISFARSGNSPESIATVDIAESLCKEVYHIALTCNKDGELAKKVGQLGNGLTILLPPDSEDKGLAMTGSFTSMVLASTYIANFFKNEHPEKEIQHISDAAYEGIRNCAPGLKIVSFRDFNRIVFLGSGPLEGIARESHLKVQELTDGHVVGKFDSFLGFRHGPKAVVDKKTILVFLFSADEKVFQYEKDLVLEILRDNIAMQCVGVFCDQDQSDGLELDLNIVFNVSKQYQASDYTSVLYVLPAQIIGFYKSLDLGLNPDAPSQNNVISRVVQGVTIYPT